MAKLSGKDYAEVLQEMMAQISESIEECHPVDSAKMEEKTEEQTTPDPHKMAATASPLTNAMPTPTVRPTERTSSVNIATTDLNPPEVQKYVVEHTVKSEDTVMHARSSHRLCVFSGRVPHPQHEVDYDTWRSGADLILKDPAISEIQRSRLILDSLLPPAADIVKHLSPDLSADLYFKQVDSAYGARWGRSYMLNLWTGCRRKSIYLLATLQVVLSLAVRRGGVSESEVNKHLRNQFCRGCWDNTLISEQLKQKKSSPPSFAELLLLLRIEEDREAAKIQRMKQHLGATKQKVTSHAQFAYEQEEKGMCAKLTTLVKQLSAIQQQLSALTVMQSQGRHGSGAPRPSNAMKHHSKPKTVGVAAAHPKPGFCFHCGEDGHIKPQCDNSPNSALVSAKRKQFNNKKQNWQRQSPSSEQLN